jgi:hypothetical protein
MQRLRGEQLDTLIVPGVGIETALNEHETLIREQSQRFRNGGDLTLPRTQAVTVAPAADEQRS